MLHSTLVADHDSLGLKDDLVLDNLAHHQWQNSLVGASSMCTSVPVYVLLIPLTVGDARY